MSTAAGRPSCAATTSNTPSGCSNRHSAGPFLNCETYAADRWTWLMIVVHTQLRLARPLATDLRRPWEKPTPPERLTPARVRRGFRNIHTKIASPASAPNPLTQALDGHQVPRTRPPPHATTSDASSPPARHTNVPHTTRRAPNHDARVKDQAKSMTRPYRENDQLGQTWVNGRRTSQSGSSIIVAASPARAREDLPQPDGPTSNSTPFSNRALSARRLARAG